nr:hypothetical protein CKG001_30780 [Bdellovibrio sp. CKG001]
MKTTIKLLGVLAAMMALSACAGGSGGAEVHTVPTQNVSMDSAGNCSLDFVSRYNDIVLEASLLNMKVASRSSESEIISQIRVVHNACEQFLAKHSDVSCKAKLDYKETTIESTKVKADCDKVKSALKEFDRG